MSNIGESIKSEILRLSKKVMRQHVGPIQSATASHRRQLAALKKQVNQLEREIAVLKRVAAKTITKPVVAEGTTNRFTAKGLKSLRSRLGLSAENFGRLVEASGQTIYNWEAQKTEPRPAQITAIVSLRGIGKREALSRLELINRNRAAS